jgi:dUTP pyrophosphatase
MHRPSTATIAAKSGALINHGTADFIIKRGDRIAQRIVAVVAHATLQEVAALDDTARGNNGFGSSGC